MRNLLFVSLFLLLSVCVSGAVIHVDPSGTGDYSTIQVAIDAAEPNDVIVLQPGVYQGLGNRDLDPNGQPLTICGTDPDNWDVVMATVIDPQGTNEDHHRGFHFHSNETNLAIVEGITIRNGYAEYGGGVLCQQSSPLIRCCLIELNEGDNCYWPMGSGGIHCENSQAVIEYCILNGNKGGFGGGLFCGENSDMILTNSIVTGNRADGFTAGASLCQMASGGGVGITGNSYLLIEHCTIADNLAFRPPQCGFFNGQDLRILGDGGVAINNSIIWSDSSYDSINVYSLDQITITYSDIPEGELVDGTGVIHEDPSFVKRRFLRVWPETPYPYSEVDYHLLPESPCVNAGDLDFDYADCVDVDGERRIMADRIDVGADEVGPKQADFDRNGYIDVLDLQLFSQHWLEDSNHGNWDPYYDLHHDEMINFADFTLFSKDWCWIDDYL